MQFSLPYRILTSFLFISASADLTATKPVVRNTAIHADWSPNKSVFWYQKDLADGRREFVQVDASSGLRQIIDQLPYIDQTPMQIQRPSTTDVSRPSQIRFINKSNKALELFWVDAKNNKRSYGIVPAGTSRDMSTYKGHAWTVEDEKGHFWGAFIGKAAPTNAIIGPNPPPEPANRIVESRSTHQWVPKIREYNVWLEHYKTRKSIQLSSDGSAEDPYTGPVKWSPDNRYFVAMQTKPAQRRMVSIIESAPDDQLQPKLHSFNYLKPGDTIAEPRPRLFDASRQVQIPISDALIPNPWSVDSIHWALDSSEFYFKYHQRGHQLTRIIAVATNDGSARILLEEQSDTFIDYSQKTFLHWLDETNELVWASERDGWNHLYMIDIPTGKVAHQITRGDWLVRKVEHIDVKKRIAWLRVMGIYKPQDPYHYHLARVNLDGSDFKVLTAGDGTHSWQWSPDKRFFIDTWSRVDQPPIIELRDAESGRLICELERADISELLATGWSAPERFVTKGRDQFTDIYGIIFRPRDFDPQKRYPIIEQIYAGPHNFFVPKKWGHYESQQALADLGFVVVQIDGMGTNWRSRAFHDVCFKNLKDSGFPDRIAWMRAAAETRPWMDINRVGITGGSAGGQSALAALLFHGDFYKAAVSDSGCHDNRMDKIWWNEAWMGWPIGSEYSDNSNVTHAKNLSGKLLLIVGELDRNVDPASTMQVVDALIKADKDFDLIVIPGGGHCAGASPYGKRRINDFFIRHLQALE